MGLYTIKTTELTAGGYPKTGMLSVQTGDPWKKTVMTPNGTITYQYKREVLESDQVISIPSEGSTSEFTPTMAVPNNFWGFLDEDSEPDDFKDIIEKFKYYQQAMNRYLTILTNRFEIAGTDNDGYLNSKEYPISQLFWRHYDQIVFYKTALTTAQSKIGLEQVKKMLEQLEESDIEFSGDTAENIADQIGDFILLGDWVAGFLPGGDEWGKPRILTDGIENDGEYAVSVWNDFVNNSLGMGGLGFNATWDDVKGIVWDGVDVPDGQAKNWPIEGFEFTGLVDPEPEPEPDEEQDE